MQRHLEPELMVAADQVQAFKTADRQFGVTGFMDFYRRFCNLPQGRVVDLGTGLADYLLALRQEYANLELVGYDGSPVMVAEAQAAVAGQGIEIKHAMLTDICDTADLVISTNTLHHMHDVDTFWTAARNISNHVFVMDLVRPVDQQTARTIVDYYRSDDDIYNADFYNSLLAAFSKSELAQQAHSQGLNLVVEGPEHGLQIAVIYGKFL